MKYEMPSSNDSPIWDLWLSTLHLPTVTVADELGLFQALADNPNTPGQLAQQQGFNQRGIEVLLPMLTALGLLVKRLDNYHITDTTRNYLLPDSPFYWGGVLHRVRENSPHHDKLLAIVGNNAQTPRDNPDEPERDADAWASGELDLESAQHISRFMHSHSLPAALGMARHGDFNCVRRLLDVGGGSGCFSIALAQHYPDLHCTIMDLSAMCQLALDYVQTSGVGSQVDTRGVDMFRQAWPDGYDAVLFSNIFHDWDADTCAQLAAKACAALPCGGRIYLHEMLLDDSGTGPTTAAAFSVLMLLGTDGSQFTFSELQSLLQDAGFVNVEATATYGYYSLIRGSKP